MFVSLLPSSVCFIFASLSLSSSSSSSSSSVNWPISFFWRQYMSLCGVRWKIKGACESVYGHYRTETTGGRELRPHPLDSTTVRGSWTTFGGLLTPSLPHSVKVPGWRMHGRACKQYIFRFYNTSMFSAMRFDGDAFICQCDKEDKEASGFKMSHFYWSFTSDITAVKVVNSVAAISIFHNCEGQGHKTVSTDHNFWRERRAEADSNRGHSAFQPNALALGQTGSQISL